MESHTQDILYFIGTVFTIIGVVWQFSRAQMEKIDKRFDAIDERLSRIEQNHVDHITNPHVNPSLPLTSREKKNK